MPPTYFARTWYVAVAAAALLAVSQVHAQNTKLEVEPVSVREILTAESELTRGVQGEFAILERLYAPEFTLTSANGDVRTRTQRLSMLRSGEVRNLSRQREDERVNVYGDTGIVTGVNRLEVVIGGAERQDAQRFIHIWIKRDGAWQLVAQQFTRLPK